MIRKLNMLLPLCYTRKMKKNLQQVMDGVPILKKMELENC